MNQKLISQSVLPANPNGAPIKLIETLTAREIQVLTLVARGYQNKEIARELVIEIPTVEHHLQNVFRKLGMHTRTGAAMIALSNGFINL
jgi:DNA-binding NarL/FixJ family response regulator